MSTADSDASARDPAQRLAEADFVRIVARSDGDAVAAAGVLARVLSRRGIPFQASAARTVETRTERVQTALDHADEGDQTVAIGPVAAPEAITIGASEHGAASVAAWDVASKIGEPDPALALAGAVAAGVVPGRDGTAGILEAGEFQRRPGVAVPTEDVVDGLAHSTLVHAPFSGDPQRVRQTLGPDLEDHQSVASAVALAGAGDENASQSAGAAVERVLRPYVGGPFATLGGYADVLDATARENPGTAVALALGREVEEAALGAWRDHAIRAHSAVRAATSARYDGLLAARVEADSVPVETVARLVGAYRSPEPTTLVVAEDAAGAVGDAPVGRAMRTATEAVDGRSDGTPRRAYARFEGSPTTLVDAFREEL